jgi:two-component system KDP operon response regulator KdpE
MNDTADSPQFLALVIDDEPQMQRLLTIALETDGYKVSSASSGREGVSAAAHRRHDIILLDLGLPDMDGLEVLKRLREWTQTPVIVLTVRDGEAEKVEALDGGADDYVTKPFNTAELLARLRAALRRARRGQTEDPVFRLGEVEANLASRRVSRNGKPVKLTATEYALFRLFIQHAGKVLTHQQILREIWGLGHEAKTEYLRVYMARLREKLDDDLTAPGMFVTEPGVGYRLAAP